MPIPLQRLPAAMAVADRSLVFDNSGTERRLLLIREDERTRWLASGRPVWSDRSVPERTRRFERSSGPGPEIDDNEKDGR